MSNPTAGASSAPRPQSEAPPAGVMDASYAADRRSKPHLEFRYKSRALNAANAYRRFGPGVDSPRVLDLGAAEGVTMAETHRLLGARESIGIEYAQDLIDAAGALPPGCRLVRGDVTRPHEAVEEGTFDLVTALAILEHLREPVALMEQASRALRPGGIVVASCPAGTWDTISGALRLHKDEHHEDQIGRESFASLAGAAGLTPVHYRRFMFAPVGFLPYLRVPVSPRFADAIDRVLRPLVVFNPFFVNQLFVARKP